MDIKGHFHCLFIDSFTPNQCQSVLWRSKISCVTQRREIAPINFTHNFIVPIYTIDIKKAQQRRRRKNNNTKFSKLYKRLSGSFANNVGKNTSYEVKMADINTERTVQ